MKNIGKKLKTLACVLLIILLLILAYMIASQLMDDPINTILTTFSIVLTPEQEKLIMCVLLGVAGFIVILLLVFLLFACGHTADCLEDIADETEKMNRNLRKLIERVDHLPVLQMSPPQQTPEKPRDNGVTFHTEQRVNTVRVTERMQKETEKEEKKPAVSVSNVQTVRETPQPVEKQTVKPEAEDTDTDSTPSGIQPSKQWRCPGCGKSNSSKNAVCKYCGEKSLWKCVRCNTVNTYNTDVCMTCGARDTRHCPHCGNVIPRNAAACDLCGKEI